MKNNLYHDIKSQQLHLIVDENDVNEERKKKEAKWYVLADDFQVSTVHVSLFPLLKIV